MTGAIYMTKEGYEQHLENIKKAKEDLKKLRQSKSELAQQQGGYWEDNAALLDIDMHERIAMKIIADLEETKKRIIIINPENIENVVNVNSIVTMQISANGETENCRLKLVGSGISDYDAEVSINGPLGRAIISKGINEEVEYSVNDTTFKVKILNIEQST